MRPPIGLAAIALLGLLGGSVGASTAIAPPASNATEPSTEMTSSINTSATADRRASEIGECVSGSPGHLPPDADAEAFCSCAVDKMLTSNTPQTDAIDQCATKLHITLLPDLD